MKKLIITALLVTAATLAIASPDCRSGIDHPVGCGYSHRPDYSRQMQHRPHPNYESRHNERWIIPALLIGGLIAVEANRSPTVVQQPSPQPIYLPQAPYGYRYVNAIDPACNCSKIVLVPN